MRRTGAWARGAAAGALGLAMAACAAITAPVEHEAATAGEGDGPVTVTVLSLNLHTYQQEDALGKLESVAEGAAALGADILLLQEVGEHLTDPGRPNAGEIVRGHLERLTGADWSHAWRNAHIGFDEYHEGLSILSRAPLGDVAEHELSGGGLRRNAVVALTRIDGVALRVCTVHTTWPDGGGDAEVARLLAALDAHEGGEWAATIVGGDFNASPGSPQIRRMTGAGFLDAAAAAGTEFNTIGDPPNRRIDYQFVRGGIDAPAPRVLEVRRTFDGAVEPRVSDHAGVLAVYRFAPPGGATPP